MLEKFQSLWNVMNDYFIGCIAVFQNNWLLGVNPTFFCLQFKLIFLFVHVSYDSFDLLCISLNFSVTRKKDQLCRIAWRLTNAFIFGNLDIQTSETQIIIGFIMGRENNKETFLHFVERTNNLLVNTFRCPLPPIHHLLFICFFFQHLQGNFSLSHDNVEK